MLVVMVVMIVMIMMMMLLMNDDDDGDDDVRITTTATATTGKHQHDMRNHVDSITHFSPAPRGVCSQMACPGSLFERVVSKRQDRTSSSGIPHVTLKRRGANDLVFR